MIGLDTNVLLRWLNGGSIVHDSTLQTQQIFEVLSDPKRLFFVNLIVLTECIWVLSKKLKLDREVIADIVRTLISASNVRVESRDVVVAALASFLRHRGDFPDHLIGEINSSFDCISTVTFDQVAMRSPHFKSLQEVV